MSKETTATETSKPAEQINTPKQKRLPGQTAVDFLSDLRPKGRVVTITAIEPDGHTTTTRTFANLDKARGFIVRQNDDCRNLHFTSAITPARTSIKPRKSDIVAVVYLHVDADPSQNETIEQFKQRMRPQIERFKPAPTFVIDSGNGFQLLWELDKPLAITSEADIAAVETRNYALALALGADPSTRNIDRLLRVPGTVNYPNAKKRKDGRVECHARYVECNGNSYTLEEFSPHVTQSAEDTSKAGGSSSIPPKWQSLLHLNDPDPGGYDSRSELLAAFVTGTLHAKVADDVIIAALVDPKFAGKSIYQHVQEQGGRKCAERQLRRVKKLGPASHTVQPVKSYVMVWASDVTPRPLQWLWEGHLLRGAQELLTGIKGLGKSQIHCSLVACATTGRRWPNGAPGCQPSNVIMVTAEDAHDQVVVPRLIAAGADRKRVCLLKAIKKDDKDCWFLLGEDLDELEKMINDIGDVSLVTIDPITAFMGKINSHNTTDVRGQLGPLANLAERTNVAFSTITHPPKHGSGKAIDQFIGSQAFIAAARIGHLVIPEMQLTTTGQPIPTGRNLYTMAATNHKSMPTLAYHTEEVIAQDAYPRGDAEARIRSHAEQVEAVCVKWAAETVQASADEAIAAMSYKPSPTQAVDEFLRDMLRTGPVPAKDIFEEGKPEGLSEDQLKRARRRFGIQTRKDGLTGWVWELKK
jgi:putative DNA primase/helicase